jgi:hypothetical protein
MPKTILTDQDLRKRAIHILGNLVHYTNAKSYLCDDIETLITELRKLEQDVLTVAS